MQTTTDGQDARASRIFLRPIGSALPLGMAALAGASIMLTGYELGWLPVPQGHDVAAVILAFAVPLQYLASVFGFLGRDSAGGTGMALLGGCWTVTGVLTLLSPPGHRSPVLGSRPPKSARPDGGGPHAARRPLGGSRRPIAGKETNYGRIWDGRPWSAPMGHALLRSSGAFPFSEVVIEMKGGSRRHLASMARHLLTTPAARAGRVTRWLKRSAPRAGPLAAAAFLAAGVFAAAGPLPAASAATVPPGLGGQNWTAIPTNAKVVALTFDAGANADAVQSILGTLGKYHVTATFMLTGNFVRDFPAQSRAIAAAGYRIGDHSVSHPYFTQLTDAQMRDQVLSAQSQIKSVTGADPWPWFRFPYGDYNAHAISVVNGAGFVPVGWTVDTLGWKGTSGGITAQTVLNRVLGSLKPGEIVLMHCGSNPDDHSTLDAAALPSVIQALQARGYSFVTLDALRTPGTWGDEVNPFGNGFNVLHQRQAVNAIIASWPASKADPAVHFLRIPGTVPGAYRFDYAPNGVATGLSVADPGFDAAGTGLKDGLVLRGSNTGPWQQFIPQPDGTLKNVATGLYVNPNGTGAQLRGGTAPSPWGGSAWTWTDHAHLPG